MIALAVYVAVGLSLFAMCFNLMEEEVIQKLKRLGRFIGLIQDPVGERKIDETLQSDSVDNML
ncbi:unnamed protein product [Echinostoma caproni]|uniref:Ion_trans_2 domain-containing protein n=1 Tax=Echinostoma caproni TaxID=27848 RepID=A0A183B8M5_9TREM|nr:unnamed protein product [Echinostoma caproni]